MLVFTKWGTVKGTGIHDEDSFFKERSIEKFFKEFEHNIKNDKYFLVYNEFEVSFRGQFDGKSFTLDIGEEQKENFKNGMYNSSTIRLKKILEKQSQIESENSKNREMIAKRNSIIMDAERGIINDSEAKEVYLEHLKEKNKLEISKISQYFKELKKDWKNSFYKTNCFIEYKRIPFSNNGLNKFHLNWTLVNLLLISAATGISELTGIHSILPIASGIVLIPQMTVLSNTLFHQAKTRLPKLKNYIEEKLSNRENIKKIKEMEFETNLGQSYFKAEELDEKMAKNEKTLDNPKIIKKIDELALLLKGKDLQKRAQYIEIFRKLFLGHSVPAKTEEIDTELYLSKIKEYISQSFKGQAINNLDHDFSTVLDQEKNSLETSQFSTQSNMGQAFAVMDESQKQKVK